MGSVERFQSGRIARSPQGDPEAKWIELELAKAKGGKGGFTRKANVDSTTEPAVKPTKECCRKPSSSRKLPADQPPGHPKVHSGNDRGKPDQAHSAWPVGAVKTWHGGGEGTVRNATPPHKSLCEDASHESHVSPAVANGNTMPAASSGNFDRTFVECEQPVEPTTVGGHQHSARHCEVPLRNVRHADVAMQQTRPAREYGRPSLREGSKMSAPLTCPKKAAGRHWEVDPADRPATACTAPAWIAKSSLAERRSLCTVVSPRRPTTASGPSNYHPWTQHSGMRQCNGQAFCRATQAYAQPRQSVEGCGTGVLHRDCRSTLRHLETAPSGTSPRSGLASRSREGLFETPGNNRHGGEDASSGGSKVNAYREAHGRVPRPATAAARAGPAERGCSEIGVRCLDGVPSPSGARIPHLRPASTPIEAQRAKTVGSGVTTKAHGFQNVAATRDASESSNPRVMGCHAAPGLAGDVSGPGRPRGLVPRLGSSTLRPATAAAGFPSPSRMLGGVDSTQGAASGAQSNRVSCPTTPRGHNMVDQPQCQHRDGQRCRSAGFVLDDRNCHVPGSQFTYRRHVAHERKCRSARRRYRAWEGPACSAQLWENDRGFDGAGASVQLACGPVCVCSAMRTRGEQVSAGLARHPCHFCGAYGWCWEAL